MFQHTWVTAYQHHNCHTVFGMLKLVSTSAVVLEVQVCLVWLKKNTHLFKEVFFILSFISCINFTPGITSETKPRLLSPSRQRLMTLTQALPPGLSRRCPSLLLPRKKAGKPACPSGPRWTKQPGSAHSVHLRRVVVNHHSSLSSSKGRIYLTKHQALQLRQ